MFGGQLTEGVIHDGEDDVGLISYRGKSNRRDHDH